MSTIKIDTIEDLSASESVDVTYVVHGTAKGWARFLGGTTALVDDINMSSITDDGVGITSLNFTSSMADTNYGCMSHCTRSLGITTYDCASATIGRSTVAVGSTKLITTFHNYTSNGLLDAADSDIGFLGVMA